MNKGLLIIFPQEIWFCRGKDTLALPFFCIIPKHPLNPPSVCVYCGKIKVSKGFGGCDKPYG